MSGALLRVVLAATDATHAVHCAAERAGHLRTSTALYALWLRGLMLAGDLGGHGFPVDGDGGPWVTLDPERYAHLLAVEAAARAHVGELAALVAAEAAHAGPHATPAGRHGAMAAVLLARRGVVGSVAALAWAVGE